MFCCNELILTADGAIVFKFRGSLLFHTFGLQTHSASGWGSLSQTDNASKYVKNLQLLHFFLTLI